MSDGGARCLRSRSTTARLDATIWGADRLAERARLGIEAIGG
jgi:hypothetical protein